MPSRLARKAWEIQAEENLIYVAITRAKKSLNFIKEDEKGFYRNFMTTKSMKNEIDQIRGKIGYINHFNSGIQLVPAILDTYDKAETLSKLSPSSAEIADNKPQKEMKKKKGGLKFLDLS
jgi:ATP-dependent exoDNAse (exonuclease V) beta subunit